MGQCITCFENSNQYQGGVEGATIPHKIKRSKKCKCFRKKGQKNANGLTLNHYTEEINKNDFTICKVIGRGSFGKVYLVQRKTTGAYYAMKTLKKDVTFQTPQQIRATKAERDIMERINHPFIVRLHFAFQTPKKLYFVMDFLNGGELFYHLKREGKFTEERTKFYAAEILLALDKSYNKYLSLSLSLQYYLECLHENDVIYRDLKPENVLLDSEGHIKITDFGLSKQGVPGNNNTYSFCGTPEYIAPEVILQTGHNKASDWWSLGLMIYEMLSGINPFKIKNKSPQEKHQMIVEEEILMPPNFSNEARSLLEGLLQKRPIQRLGYRDSIEIRCHPFFEGIDFDQLQERNIEPPFIPRVLGEADIQNIDRIQ